MNLKNMRVCLTVFLSYFIHRFKKNVCTLSLITSMCDNVLCNEAIPK